MEHSSARAWATYTGRLIFCVLANSFINILPDILNKVTTKYLPATERRIFPDFSKSSGLWVLHALSFPFSFPPLHYNVHSTWTDCRLSQFPHAFPGSILHTLPVDNQHANPFKSKLGQARNCLRLRCGRIRRGKQHLFPGARLCVKGSLFDGFPCTNWGFSLPTFDYLTALSKMTSGGWKEGSSEAPYAVWFPPAGPLCVQPHGGQALEGGQRSQRPATHGSKEWRTGEEDTQPQPDLGLAGRPSSCLSALSCHTRLFTKLSFKQTRGGINNSG